MRVCVYGSSSINTPKLYQDSAYELGQLIAEKQLICVNGAGKFGVMGSVTEGCKSKNGYVVGVIHEMFYIDGHFDNNLIDEVVISKGTDLTERKQQLIDNCDCIITMPGGTGTFEEFWEVVSEKTLNLKGLDNKPICLLNINGFYDGFITQLQRAYDDQLLYHSIDYYFYVAKTPKEALDWCIDNYNKEDEIGKFSESSRFSKREVIFSGKSVVKADVSAKISTNKYGSLILSATVGFILGIIVVRRLKH